MRCTQRDKRTLWYSLYQGVTAVTDSDGNYTGEHTIAYSTPTKARMNISGGKGQAAIEEFGINTPFSRTLITDDLTTPFDTDTIFWIGIDPIDGEGNSIQHNYKCVGISRTINGVMIAIKEVDTTHDDD